MQFPTMVSTRVMLGIIIVSGCLLTISFLIFNENAMRFSTIAHYSNVARTTTTSTPETTTTEPTLARDDENTTDPYKIANDSRCHALLYPELDPNATEVAITPLPDLTADDDVLAMLADGCDAFGDRYDFRLNEDARYIGDDEVDFPIAYVVLLHADAHQFAALLSAVYAPHNVYCVHVDRKSAPAVRRATEAIAACFRNVFLATRSEDVTYASHARLQAEVGCMRDLLHLPPSLLDWRYVINLCGQDFPLRTNREIVSELKSLNGSNVIRGTMKPPESMLKRTRYVHRIENSTNKDGTITKKLVQTDQLKAPVPFNMTIRKNLAYNVFSRAFLQWALLDSEKGRALLDWSRDTYSPDEHFWLTLAALDEAPGGTGPPWAQNARYIVWYHETGKCKGYIRHYSCVFGAGDLGTITRRRALFVNKFEARFDAAPIECVRRWLDERKTGWNGAENPDRLTAARG